MYFIAPGIVSQWEKKYLQNFTKTKPAHSVSALDMTEANDILMVLGCGISMATLVMLVEQCGRRKQCKETIGDSVVFKWCQNNVHP